MKVNQNNTAVTTRFVSPLLPEYVKSLLRKTDTENPSFEETLSKKETDSKLPPELVSPKADAKKSNIIPKGYIPPEERPFESQNILNFELNQLENSIYSEYSQTEFTTRNRKFPSSKFAQLEKNSESFPPAVSQSRYTSAQSAGTVEQLSDQVKNIFEQLMGDLKSGATRSENSIYLQDYGATVAAAYEINLPVSSFNYKV